MNFDEIYQSLRQEYLSSMPEKIQTIRRQAEEGEPAVLLNSFHKLKGTGKTYGFPEITELAALVEQICRQSPPQAQVAARQALHLLEAVHSSRLQEIEFPILEDARFQALQKLLPKSISAS